MLQFNGYTDLIDLSTVREINNLVSSSNIGERFDFGDFLYTVYNSKMLGINVYKLEKFDDGEVIPRFIHIILHPEIRRNREAVVFLLKAEKDLINRGYKRTWAYILKDRLDMLLLARKFGFKDTEYNGKGYTLIKTIGE